MANVKYAHPPKLNVAELDNPAFSNFGFRWHELDPTYKIILFLNWLKIIHINKDKRGLFHHTN